MKRSTAIAGTFAAVAGATLGIVMLTSGPTDSGAYIQSRFDSAAGTPGPDTIDFGGNSYHSGQVLTIKSSNTYVRNLNLAYLKDMPQTSSGLLRTLPVTKYTKTGISVSITKGSNTFTYPNASTLFAVGDLIRILGPQRGEAVNTEGDVYHYGLFDKITALSGNTITVLHTSPETFVATTSITVYKPTENITLDNVNIDFRGREKSYGISIERSVNLMIKNCHFQGDSLPVGLLADQMKVGIRLNGVIGGTIQDGSMKNMMPKNTAAPYTISIDGSDVTVQRMRFSNCYGVASGVGRDFSQNLKYLHNWFDKQNAEHPAFDFHGNSWGEIAYNTIFNGPKTTTCVSVRYNNSYIHNNTYNYKAFDAVNTTKLIWLFHLVKENIRIENETFNVGLSYRDKVKTISQSQSYPILNLKIRNNVTKGGGTVELKDSLGEGFEYSGNHNEGSTVASSDPPRLTIYKPTKGIIKNNTTIIKADHGSSDWAIYLAAAGAMIASANRVYNEVANSTPPFKLNGGGHTFFDNVKYAANSSLFSEAAGVVNTKINNKVLPKNTPPTAPDITPPVVAEPLPPAIEPTNNPPQVTFIKKTITSNGTIDLEATATDDSKVAKVEFFNGTQLLVTEFTAPYTCVLTGVAPGTYNLIAKATDDKGLSTSVEFTATITAIPTVNAPPVITLLAPPGGNIKKNTTITITANATDDSKVVKVVFYSGYTIIKTETTAPYTFPFNVGTVRQRTIHARAYDDKGLMTKSNSVLIKVK